MEKYSLKKLWDLRGKLDNAVITENYDLIKKIRDEYVQMMKNDGNINFDFLGEKSLDNSTQSIDYENNVNKILKNIENYWLKYVENEDVSFKVKGDFLAGKIWILRGLFDQFLFEESNQKESDRQLNMILGKLIIDELKDLDSPEKLTSHNNELELIVREVEQGYESKYGKEEPTDDYDKLYKEVYEK